MAYKYKAVGKIMKSGQRIGFVVQYLDSKGKRHTHKMNDTAIKKMTNEGETFNLTYDGRGFKLRDSNKKISDLPITHMDNKRERKVSLSRSMKHKVVIDAFTGDELKQYINNLGIAKLKERDFVQGIIEYCSHPVNRVLSISGLRGTGKRGVLFESIIVAHTKMVADKYDNALYYYHDTNNREVDLIIERQTMDEFDDLYLYYEIKMTRDPNIAVVKSKWINDSAVNKFAEAQGTVVGKGIIYGGDTQGFSGFTDKNMLPPKGMSLQDIERQNSGIELIAAEDYLLHTEDKLQSLERHAV